VTAGVLAGSLISAAQATPSLPSRTPAQLLADLASRTGPPPAFTGTVVETASLGLPELPVGGDPTAPQSLVTGSHTVRVWYSDPRHIRLAIPGQMSETDLIRSGQDIWMWSSVQDTATHYRLPATPPRLAPGTVPGAVPGTALPEPGPVPMPLTPQQAAAQVLAAVGPTTRVSVANNVMVAGEACYELVLAPKDSRSLIGQVRIAIDAARDVPLRVQVLPRGSAEPAFQTGFTSISFTQPAAANFAFTPPPGATVVQGHLPASRPGTKRIVAGPVRAGVKVTGTSPNTRVAVITSGSHGTVVGRGWLAVAVLAGASPEAVLRGSPLGHRLGGGAHRTIMAGVPGPAFGALLGSASPVHGSWGSGRLLRTKLVSVLLTSDGRMLIGAVTPGLLYSAAAQTRGLVGQAGR
jgi:hypothetical protein